MALGVAGVCLSVLLVAAWLKPDLAGEETHRQLGFGQCQFLQTTGLPCPSCGMTTSFAWFVRGNLVASLYVQPMGMVLAILAGVGFWVGLYVALTGRPVYRLLRMIPPVYLWGFLLGWAVLAWGWKILIHLNGLDGWGR